MIELKNIDVTFQNGSHEFKAVDNVSLKINKGEIFGIVGPSGAGKSTLVRVINLLQRPTNGEVIIEGSDITKFNRKQLRKTRLNIGMIFQHFNLISGSTIAENVAFSLYANNYPKDKIKDRVQPPLQLHFEAKTKTLNRSQDLLRFQHYLLVSQNLHFMV